MSIEDVTKGIFFPIEVIDPKARVQEYLDAYRRDAGEADTFDASLMRNIRVLSATAKPTGKVVFDFEVLPRFCSRANNMHGGAVALLTDMCTTMAVAPMSTKDFWHFGGVSRVLSVTYLRPIRKGITITVKCKVMQIGKNLATIHMKVYRKSDNVLLCVGEHTKAAVDIRLRL